MTVTEPASTHEHSGTVTAHSDEDGYRFVCESCGESWFLSGRECERLGVPPPTHAGQRLTFTTRPYHA